MPAQTFTLFCDETGNTGPHFDSAEQPLYVEGGWLVPDNDQSRLEARFLQLEALHKFTPKTKATKLKDSAKGREYLAEVVAAMAEVATPFYYIVEKRYFICAKAVATYFDPNYNPTVDGDEPHDPDRRKARADALYAASQSIVSAFARAFREKDAVGIKNVGDQWASYLASHGEGGLAMQLRFSLPNIVENMRDEFTRLAAHFPPGYDTLNAPSVAQVCQLLEQRALDCRIVHDQCGPHERIYTRLFEIYRDAPRSVRLRPDGSIDVHGFKYLQALEFGDSEARPLLRAADYLLAICGDFLRRASLREEIPAATRAAAHHGLARMMAAAVNRPLADHRLGRQIGEIMAADAWVARLAERFHGSV